MEEVDGESCNYSDAVVGSAVDTVPGELRTIKTIRLSSDLAMDVRGIGGSFDLTRRPREGQSEASQFVTTQGQRLIFPELTANGVKVPSVHSYKLIGS